MIKHYKCNNINAIVIIIIINNNKEIYFKILFKKYFFMDKSLNFWEFLVL